MPKLWDISSFGSVGRKRQKRIVPWFRKLPKGEKDRSTRQWKQIQWKPQKGLSVCKCSFVSENCSFVSNLWIILKQTMPSMPGIVKKGTIWSAHGTNFYFFFGVSQSVENANVSLIASNSIVSQMRQTIHHSCNIVFQIQWFPKNHLSPGGFWRMWLCNTKIFEGGKKGSEERSEQEQTQGMENGMQHALQRDGCSNKCMFIFVRIKWRTSKLKKVAREIFHFCG